MAWRSWPRFLARLPDGYAALVPNGDMVSTRQLPAACVKPGGRGLARRCAREEKRTDALLAGRVAVCRPFQRLRMRDGARAAANHAGLSTAAMMQWGAAAKRAVWAVWAVGEAVEGCGCRYMESWTRRSQVEGCRLAGRACVGMQHGMAWHRHGIDMGAGGGPGPPLANTLLQRPGDTIPPPCRRRPALVCCCALAPPTLSGPPVALC